MRKTYHFIFFVRMVQKIERARGDNILRKPIFGSPQEREAFCAGYERGMREGLKKASLLIQLVASDSEAFEESILQNSKEAAKLRKIFTEKGE